MMALQVIGSETSEGVHYMVDLVAGTCTCPAHQFGGMKYCKHMRTAIDRAWEHEDTVSRQVGFAASHRCKTVFVGGYPIGDMIQSYDGRWHPGPDLVELMGSDAVIGDWIDVRPYIQAIIDAMTPNQRIAIRARARQTHIAMMQWFASNLEDHPEDPETRLEYLY